MREPGYWMYESTGVLRPAVEAYLRGDDMTPDQIAAMRAYLRQWIYAPHWRGSPYLEALRRTVDGLKTPDAITAWRNLALGIGMDPI